MIEICHFSLLKFSVNNSSDLQMTIQYLRDKHAYSNNGYFPMGVQCLALYGKDMKITKHYALSLVLFSR